MCDIFDNKVPPELLQNISAGFTPNPFLVTYLLGFAIIQKLIRAVLVTGWHESRRNKLIQEVNGFMALKGLSHEIDFKNVDKNLQN
jgi:hypothetical protein